MPKLQKAQLIKMVSRPVFHKADKVSLNSTTHKIVKKFKGVWGFSPGVSKKLPILITAFL